MTDTPLLRLARIVAGIAYDQWHPNDSRSVAMDQLVRDLEAAESMRLRQADCSENEAPARRTITREEAGQAQLLLDRVATGTVGLQVALPLLAAAWRITVEDA